jgi:hypothetical protein
MDGSFLDEGAFLDGQKIRLGLMAMPVSGVYSLVIKAAAEADWGVTVVYQDPEPGAAVN